MGVNPEIPWKATAELKRRKAGRIRIWAGKGKMKKNGRTRSKNNPGEPCRQATQNLDFQVGRMCVFVRLPTSAGMHTKYRDYIHFIMLCQASVALEARELQGNINLSGFPDFFKQG